MKKKIFMLILIICTANNLESAPKGGSIQTNIASGNYVPGEIITQQSFQILPIPQTNNDYALYQSIGIVSNVVIGSFESGERTITLIQDRNSDGKVDIVKHWFITLKTLSKEPVPEKYCTAETFRILKESIVNGEGRTVVLGGQNYKLGTIPQGISKVRYGIPGLNVLLKNPANISKSKQGLRARSVDSDDPSSETITYSFSYNNEDGTADMAFDVKYYYRFNSKVSPIINMFVYCKNSKDPFAIETVKMLMESTKDYFEDTDNTSDKSVGSNSANK